MITIVSATNRPDSNTLKIALEYQRLLKEKGHTASLLNLENLAAFDAVQEEYLFPAKKFIFVTPEYNGSIPGVLKIMIDVSNIKKAYHGKKAMLVGVATGRAGNLRGMDHLTGVLNHLKMSVYWNKLPISKVSEELDASGQLFKAPTLKAVHHQIEEFITF
jgi:chromate reductase, NAD(P)H dehydrogenase (quinone)